MRDDSSRRADRHQINQWQQYSNCDVRQIVHAVPTSCDKVELFFHPG